MNEVAQIKMWGEVVGALAYDDITNLGVFEYEPTWRSSGFAIDPIHLPISAQKFSFPTLSAETFKKLPAVFADSLPDDFGNALINAYLARLGRSADSFTPVERLLYTGVRGMGALEYYQPMVGSDNSDKVIDIASLVSMAQTVLNARDNINVPFAKDKEDALTTILQVGTSAGGARAKAVIAINEDRSEIRSGQIPAPEGFKHYLIKFDGVVESKVSEQTFGDPQGFGRIEYAYYLMAKDCGIDMMPSEILEENGRAHFLTQRFDRHDNKKAHAISLCALAHADYKKPGEYSYEEMLGLARQLRLPRESAINIFRRMVFNVIARNQDDHTKNQVFLKNSFDSSWRLSPAFDVTFSYKEDSPWVNQHQMTVNGKRDHFVLEDLLSVGSLIGNFEKDARKIIRNINQVISQWSDYASDANVQEDWTRVIKKSHRLNIS